MLLSGKFKLYYGDVTAFNNGELFNRSYSLVSPQRRAKIDKYVYNGDKFLSLGAELLLRQSLIDTGYEISAPEYAYTKTGKPFLKNFGDVHFSISHSGNFVLCSVSPCETGCDIEKIKDIDIEIAKRFFCKSEYEDIASMENDVLKKDAFYRYWTLKESFMKAVGLGMSLPLNKFEIKITDGNASVNQNVNKEKYYLQGYDEINGYKCAVCFKNADVFPTPEKKDFNEIIYNIYERN